MSLIKTYQDYLNAIQNSPTEMFWVVPEDIIIDPNFKFDIYFSHDNEYDRKMNHVFLNGEHYDGVMLMSKHRPISEREFNTRFLITRKEWNLRASNPKAKLYDIVFISYKEPNADSNYETLYTKYPNAKRVNGVKGIHNAHIKAAELSDTSMFWVVDGDALILEDFKFDYHVPTWDKETVHVWRSKNPINNLEYGYGGVKLLPKQLTLNMDVTSTDMTTSISNSFKIMDSASNITAFNTDAYSTWKSAFRECVKLASKTIDRQVDEETKQRLDTWCTQGADKLFGEFAIAGALAGKLFAETHPTETHKINDFDWLYQQFQLQTFR
jgi:hypothetical protein